MSEIKTVDIADIKEIVEYSITCPHCNRRARLGSSHKDGFFCEECEGVIKIVNNKNR